MQGSKLPFEGRRRAAAFQGLSVLLALFAICAGAETPPTDLVSTFEARLGLGDHPGITITASPATAEERFVYAHDAEAQRIFTFQVIETESGLEFERVDAEPWLPGVQGTIQEK